MKVHQLVAVGSEVELMLGKCYQGWYKLEYPYQLGVDKIHCLTCPPMYNTVYTK